MRRRENMVKGVVYAVLSIVALAWLPAASGDGASAFFAEHAVPRDEFSDALRRLLPVQYRHSLVVEQPFLRTVLDMRKPEAAAEGDRGHVSLGSAGGDASAPHGISDERERQAKLLDERRMIHNRAAYELSDAAIDSVGTLSSLYRQFLRELATKLPEDQRLEISLDEQYKRYQRYSQRTRRKQQQLLIWFWAASDDARALFGDTVDIRQRAPDVQSLTKQQRDHIEAWARERRLSEAVELDHARDAENRVREKLRQVQQLLDSMPRTAVLRELALVDHALNQLEPQRGLNMPVMDALDELERDDGDQVALNGDDDLMIAHSPDGKQLVYDPEFIRHCPVFRASPVLVLRDASQRGLLGAMSGGIRRQIAGFGPGVIAHGPNVPPPIPDTPVYVSLELSLPRYAASVAGVALPAERVRSASIDVPRPGSLRADTAENSPQPSRSHHGSGVKPSEAGLSMRFSSIVVYELSPGPWFGQFSQMMQLAYEEAPAVAERYFGPRGADADSQVTSVDELVPRLASPKGNTPPLSSPLKRASFARAPLARRWCYAVVGYDMHLRYDASTGTTSERPAQAPSSASRARTGAEHSHVSPPGRKVLHLPEGPLRALHDYFRGPSADRRRARAREPSATPPPPRQSLEIIVDSASPLVLGRIACHA